MKRNRAVSLLLALCLLLSCLGFGALAEAGHIDYAGSIVLDMNSETLKQEVQVKTFIDGDTTHFYVPEDVNETGVLKARYLAVNTPETTGKVEEYGKRASQFTKDKLSAAVSIIVESDDGKWNLDSTGDRHLVWVWYQEAEGEPYRNLNIELLQNGLAIANSSAQNRYGDTCMAAIAQAKAEKLSVYSGQKDPDFYYGDAIELTLRELRMHPEEYNGKKVAFSGVITMNDSNSVYVEARDEETGLMFGMPVYYGFGLSGAGLDTLKVGNESRIVGTMQYYEAGDAWQVSGLTYRMMQPKDPGNIQKLSEGHSPAWVPLDAKTFAGDVTVSGEEGEEVFPFARLAMATSVEMTELKVLAGYTTQDKDSSSFGAITLICEAEDAQTKVNVRLMPMKDENGALIGQERYIGKTIGVRGIVDSFEGEYQIKVFTPAGVWMEE